MREFDFRAYDTKKKMWTNYAICDGSWRCMDKHTGVWTEDESRYKIMQYTGLKDKNGKKIFEGDIVRVEYDSRMLQEPFSANASVYFDDETHMWGLSFEFEEEFELYQYDDCIEVIGNVYENKELLE